MAKLQAHELLSLVLGRADDSELVAAIRRAIAERMIEGQLVDFKGGALAVAPHFAEKLRKMVCGFSNATGGVVVIGVDETPASESYPHSCADKLAGCTVTGFDQLAAHALQALSGARPVIRAVEVDGHHVLLVAVERSPTLLRVWASGGPKAYLRMGESTNEVPNYLELDLMLGRRERVSFMLHAHAANASRSTEPRRLRWEVSVHNESLAWAEKVRVGVVGVRVDATEARVPSRRVATTDAIDRAIQVYDQNDGKLEQTHHSWTLADVGPMDAPLFTFDNGFVDGARRVWDTWSAAVYVTAPNAEISWFTITAHCDWSLSSIRPEVTRHVEGKPIVFAESTALWNQVVVPVLTDVPMSGNGRPKRPA
jgi:hypothetical protein